MNIWQPGNCEGRDWSGEYVTYSTRPQQLANHVTAASAQQVWLPHRSDHF